MKVAITPSSFAQQDQAPLEMLERAGLEVIPNPYKRRLTESEAVDFLVDKDGLIAGLEPLTRRVMESAQALRAIARVGIGMDNVDHTAAAELNIKVSNTPEGPTAAVAELTVAALLTICRQIIPMSRDLHAGKWPKMISTGLDGLHVLFVGFGRIGSRVFRLLKPFGINALVCDPYLKAQDPNADYALVNLEQGLAQADVITLHASGDNVILGRPQFQMMKQGAIILNCARGGLIDESELARALDSGTVASAWLDTFLTEPYEGPLLKYDQVLLTPHVGTYTRQCRLSMEMAAVKNLLQDMGLDGETDRRM